ncbi:hypothetical protein SAMN05444483_101730 [Salegentibacter echinorum]|uniref:Addiction module component n=1 Tax=Salegentibacter echinorum TaxID=1073325 RepID=A0A1M5CYV8_SALEC|nr:hypothetical protein [Salegentibacter echinorum]SHF59919.1 hypothetical protein SAMN05444483_101730 [Salegentibacter echinorum]
MDLQTRKLDLITYLVQIQDEEVLDKIENYILETKNDVSDFKPFSREEFENRIRKSEKDFENCKFKTQAELEKLSEKW